MLIASMDILLPVQLMEVIHVNAMRATKNCNKAGIVLVKGIVRPLDIALVVHITHVVIIMKP